MSSPWDVQRQISRITDRRRIGVIPIRGAIGGAVRTRETLRVLAEARRNPRVRAVVLDVDSPGGAATASEALYLAVRRIADEKPVVAWIRGTGASGAYFLACGATRILAFPSAIVGSIGVISVRPVLVEALRRIGAGVQVSKTGAFKDLGAPWREATAEDRAKEKELVDAIFRRFLHAVQAARGFDDETMARVATGEVWLGEQAADLDLVDALADDEELAVIEAQRLADLPHRELARMGPRRTVLQRLGVPGAGMGPPGRRWVTELESWMRVPQPRL